MDAKLEAEHQRATEIEQQLHALIEKARGLILEHFAPLSAAIEAAEKLVAEAHTVARKYNLDTGHAWCLNEDFALFVNHQPARLWQENLTDSAVRVSGETAPQPGVRLRIPQDVSMRDYPRECTVAVFRPKAERLIAERRAYRV
jgi:hypothetical protein